MTREPQPRWPDPATPIATLHVALDDEGAEPAAHELSAVAREGATLFLAADEAAHIEIVHALPDGGFGAHENVALASLFPLPGDDEELDLEGLAIDSGKLWIVGSHARTRRKLKKGEPASPASLARLAEIRENPNRAFLGCVPLVALEGGRHALATEGAAMLSIKKGEDALLRRLGEDVVLAPFLAIPAKENGLDIEGIAVVGDRVTLGLRGPVVGGWACLIDVMLRPGGTYGLKLDGPLVKHWLDLDGLGVRDLKRDGDDLLILAGPSLAVGGPAALYRWRGWAPAERVESVRVPELAMVLPAGYRCDRPEALLPWRNASGAGLLVLVDGPHPSRLGPRGLSADVFALPG